jgi:Arc/MetJ-type ribon-helix-helix transcriptional regulator
MVSRGLAGATDEAQALVTGLVWMIVWNRVHMHTIQVVIDDKLLKATDRAAQRTKRNRSELIREALREHLRNLELRALEDRDRQGYSAQRPTPEESVDWETEAAWPAE